MSYVQGSRNVELGDWGERQVLTYLLAKKCVALQVSRGEGPAMLEGHLSAWRAPDILAFGKRGPFWAEVKTKDGPVLHRASGELRHGIDARGVG